MAEIPILGVDVVLKDRNGDEVIYEEVKKVVLNGTDGNEVTFSAGELLEGLDIGLDMSNGDQTVEAPEGYLLKSATIKKPETLIPENIAEGIDIAGIVGTLAAGGGGSNVRFASGTVKGTNTSGWVSINHGLGEVPDLFFAFINTSGNVPSTASTSTMTSCVLMSSALKAAIGSSYGTLATKPSSTARKVYNWLVSDSSLESGSAPLFSAATAEEVILGCSSYSTNGYTYFWAAFTGLV